MDMSFNQSSSQKLSNASNNNASIASNKQKVSFKSYIYNIKNDERYKEIIRIRNKISYNNKRIFNKKLNNHDEVDTELTDQDYVNALDWYEKQFHSAALLCSNIENSTDPEITHFKKCIKNIPICITRSIRQICKCKEKCIDEFLYDIQIEKCSLYEFNVDAFNNEYVECCSPFKFSDGKLRYIQERTELYEATKFFFKVIDELCMDLIDFDIVRCAAYELQDECFSEAICFESNFVYVVTDECVNSFFNEQIDELKAILNFTVFDDEKPVSHIKKREITSEISKINDNKFIESNNHYTEYITESKSKKYELYDIKIDFFLCFAIFITILSILFSKKNDIKKQIILFVCSICLIVLGIAYYLF